MNLSNLVKTPIEMSPIKWENLDDMKENPYQELVWYLMYVF